MFVALVAVCPFSGLSLMPNLSPHTFLGDFPMKIDLRVPPLSGQPYTVSLSLTSIKPYQWHLLNHIMQTSI